MHASCSAAGSVSLQGVLSSQYLRSCFVYVRVFSADSVEAFEAQEGPRVAWALGDEAGVCAGALLWLNKGHACTVQGAAATGDVAFVRASHFLTLAQQAGGKFLRRQDVPVDAVADASTIERWAAEVECTIKLRVDYPDEEELQLGMRFPPFVIIS